jgi:predicted CoA-binding protein
VPITDDHSIATLLRSVGSIALLGASARPERPSHRVMQFLLTQGYEVLPVNPGLAGGELLGQRVFASLHDIGRPIDMVDVFRDASHLPAIVEEVLALEIRTLWTQLEVIDETAAAHAERHGVRVVMDRCPAIEWPRLVQAGLL